jgi:hypothetical protein
MASDNNKRQQIDDIASAVAEKQAKQFTDLKLAVDTISTRLTTLEQLVKAGGSTAKKPVKTKKGTTEEKEANGTVENKDKPEAKGAKAMNNMNYFKHMFKTDEATRKKYWKPEYEDEIKKDEAAKKALAKKTGAEDQNAVKAGWLWKQTYITEAMKKEWTSLAKAAGGKTTDTSQLTSADS